MPNTAQEYDKVIDICQDIFVKKMQDYGTAWRILRPTSVSYTHLTLPTNSRV